VAVLYIVGTPIGNLGDITFRALETFKNADIIACEDTRHTLELLTHFDIRKPLISCRAQNEEKAIYVGSFIYCRYADRELGGYYIPGTGNI